MGPTERWDCIHSLLLGVHEVRDYTLVPVLRCEVPDEITLEADEELRVFQSWLLIAYLFRGSDVFLYAIHTRGMVLFVLVLRIGHCGQEDPG